MTADPVNAIARAVLYEGYLLYPYRPSAVKNQLRWTIGGIHPRDSGEPWQMQAQCLVEGAAPRVTVELRYLQVVMRDGWEEGVEQARMLSGSEVALEPVAAGVHRVTARVVNQTPLAAAARREDWLPHTMASAHLVLRVLDGRFVSQIDPPEALRSAAEACRQVGAWPVLVGSEAARDTMLAAPIILEDFPRVAEESPGDLFDGTEIDEILTLRILTLTDAEKEEIRRTDARARRLLERTEALTPEELMALHGRMRGGKGAVSAPERPPVEECRPELATSRLDPQWDPWAQTAPIERHRFEDRELRLGQRVRLVPGGRADIFDLALAGRIAVIEAIEQDFDDQFHIAVVVEDDPGRDLGEMRQPGHRFFFKPSEVEPLSD